VRGLLSAARLGEVASSLAHRGEDPARQGARSVFRRLVGLRLVAPLGVTADNPCVGPSFMSAQGEEQQSTGYGC